MITLEEVFEMLKKEREYAQGWGGDDHDKDWSLMDWLTFAKKYLNEAELAYANYCPDIGTVLVRFVKATSLLAAALQYHTSPQDTLRVAGVSSSKNFPLNNGGLADKIAAVGMEPCNHDNHFNCGYSKPE